MEKHHAMGKLAISMAIFNSYIESPEGTGKSSPFMAELFISVMFFFFKHSYFDIITMLIGGFTPSEKYKLIGMIIPNLWKQNKRNQRTRMQCT